MSSSLLDTYSVQDEAKKLLWEGILHNPLHKFLPDGIEEAARHISFSGLRFPFIPVNWRYAESVSALKAFQGAMLNVLLKKKYGAAYQAIHIDTNHAQLFIMSCFHPLCVIDPEGEKISTRLGGPQAGYERYFPNCNIHHIMEATTPFIDAATTNIYKLGDGKYYHVHGSMNAAPSQKVLGIDKTQHPTISSFKEACDIIEASTLKHTANELDQLMNETHRQAGTICHSISEYHETPHGKANAHVGLYEIHQHLSPSQGPSWWPNSIPNHTDSPTRPLLGLKILDLTRMVASPTITRELAELGASVLRITSPHVTDLSSLHLDLGWGKWNAHFHMSSMSVTLSSIFSSLSAHPPPSTLIQVAISYYNQWFVNSCGTYPPEIWDDLWSRYDYFVFHSSDNMGITIPACLQWLREKKTPMFDEKYFEVRENAALGIGVKTIKPVLNFVEGGVEVGYNVGSRPNGMDAPKWPANLLTEVVV
ncbi:hypothetical protein AN958_04558 [Leucoagaricus sp. SymC.cos]|nr:hypothetical protein AN958_04558 [Leucoagaricus sp. SymC.cos]